MCLCECMHLCFVSRFMLLVLLSMTMLVLFNGVLFDKQCLTVLSITLFTLNLHGHCL